MILVLSGRSGSGKTSACALAEKALASSGMVIGGVLCEAVFEGGIKVGILARDVSRGPWKAAASLARSVPADIRRVPFPDRGVRGTIRFGMWDFNEAALNTADEATSEFIAASGSAAGRPVAFVDELGPMELDHDLGMTRTLAAIDALSARASAARMPDPPLDCIVVARPEIADRLAVRWPSSRRMDMETLSVRAAADALIQALGQGDGFPSGWRRS